MIGSGNRKSITLVNYKDVACFTVVMVNQNTTIKTFERDRVDAYLSQRAADFAFTIISVELIHELIAAKELIASMDP